MLGTPHTLAMAARLRLAGDGTRERTQTVSSMCFFGGVFWRCSGVLRTGNAGATATNGDGHRNPRVALTHGGRHVVRRGSNRLAELEMCEGKPGGELITVVLQRDGVGWRIEDRPGKRIA